jgi:hypothetical protein
MNTNLNLIAVGMMLAGGPARLGQPSIITQPQNQTNVVSTTATFWVEATGPPPLAYQWQKLGAAWSDLAGRTATNLCLTNVQTSHAGDYRVVITNADGAITSDVARLTILSPPRITPTTNLQHQAVHIGSSAAFAVTASGTAPLAYQWRLDGQELPGRTNSTLTFSAVQPADEGDYTVVVTNLLGAVPSEPARLWVVPPPSAFIKGNFTNGTFRFPYYYLMPTDYDPARSYPLVLMFHGAYGDEIMFTNGAGGPPGWLGYGNYPASKVFASYRQQATDPVICVWPTVRAGEWVSLWTDAYVRQATNLLDSLIARFNIDTNRVYVGGLSAGAHIAWDLLGLRSGFFAGGLDLAGFQGTIPASAIKDVPLWVITALDDDSLAALVRSLRMAGGNPIYTEYQSGGHLGGIMMGASTPAVVDWLLAQRRGVAPTNEPLLTITSPTLLTVLPTGATSVSLAGSAAALDHDVTRVAWTNYANNAGGAPRAPTSGVRRTSRWLPAGPMSSP